LTAAIRGSVLRVLLGGVLDDVFHLRCKFRRVDRYAGVCTLKVDNVVSLMEALADVFVARFPIGLVVVVASRGLLGLSGHFVVFGVG
jgi:hypothetical protein